jgi:hypothetical protein
MCCQENAFETTLPKAHNYVRPHKTKVLPMSLIDTYTLARDPSRFAKWIAKLTKRPAKSAPLPKTINDHLARDIGIDPNDLERLRMEWPSQTTRPLI